MLKKSFHIDNFYVWYYACTQNCKKARFLESYSSVLCQSLKPAHKNDV